jgi:RHS repeat-associated protein
VQRTTYTWDIENRLTGTKAKLWSLDRPTGTDNQMSYNADGLRVKRYDSGGWKYFVWDLRNVLLETNTLWATQARYTLQPEVFGNLLSQRRGATSHFFHFDALGSTVALTTAGQALSDAYRYKAYGEPLSQSGWTQNPFRWVGRLGYFYDPDLVQYYVRARHYDPRLARWLSVDPIGYGGGINLYEYVGGLPLMRTDPMGIEWSCAAAVTVTELSLVGVVAACGAAVIPDVVGEPIEWPACAAAFAAFFGCMAWALGACVDNCLQMQKLQKMQREIDELKKNMNEVKKKVGL